MGGCGSSRKNDKCILLIGAPASGKGTQAEKIRTKYGLFHLSSGDLLREEIKNETPLGKEAKAYMDAGDLVPDRLIFEIIEKALSKSECKRVMFDGFPRNEEQAKKLDDMLAKLNKEIAAVIYLDVNDDVLVERCTGRRIHPGSGRSYHIKLKPPKVPDTDDVTGEPLIQRSDDNAETVKNRLKKFHENNRPVVNHYESKKVVHTIEGTRPIEEVWKDVDDKLKNVLEEITQAH